MLRQAALIGTLALAAALIPASAWAKDHGNGRHGQVVRSGHDHDRVHRDRDRGRDFDFDDGRPPGWNKGKKVGWGNCDVPPGQAKKIGCHPGLRRHVVVRHHRRHGDGDHDRDDRIRRLPRRNDGDHDRDDRR